jgi:hypothetical protein
VQPKITGKKYVGLPHRLIFVYKFKNDLLKKWTVSKMTSANGGLGPI